MDTIIEKKTRYAIDDCIVDIEVEYKSGAVKIWIFDHDFHVIGNFTSTTEAWKAKTIIEKLFDILHLDPGELGTKTLKRVFEEQDQAEKEVVL